MEAKALRVLIVDDHPIVISGCKALLAVDATMEVRDAGDADVGQALYFSWKPDVAVVDLNLPGLSGLEVCRRIRQRDERAKIIIFAINDDPTLFIDAVRQVARGGVYLHPDMARQIAFLRNNASASKAAALNSRELEILRMLAAGKSMGDIADALHVSYKTVANNCTALKQKLGARSSMDLMRIAMETSGGCATFRRAPDRADGGYTANKPE